jgi:hypothetical protein
MSANRAHLKKEAMHFIKVGWQMHQQKKRSHTGERLFSKHINRKGVHNLEKGQLASASIEEEFMHLIKVNQYAH